MFAMIFIHTAVKFGAEIFRFDKSAKQVKQN